MGIHENIFSLAAIVLVAGSNSKWVVWKPKNYKNLYKSVKCDTALEQKWNTGKK